MVLLLVALLLIFPTLVWKLFGYGKPDPKLPPGPRPLPIIGNFHMLGKLPHRALTKLAQQYGPIMSIRLGQVQAIVISSPKYAEVVLKQHDAVFSGRPETQAWLGGKKAMVFTPYGSYWRRVRMMCAQHLLSAAKIAEFEGLRKGELLMTLRGLAKAALTREVVDIEMLVGGINTTIFTVIWALSALIKNSRILRTLQQELDVIIGKDRMVKDSDLHNLPYLDMVIKETFRLYSIVPLLLPHESQEDVSIDGYVIPKKSRMIINIWTIGRDPKIWSENVEEFYPERFVNSDIDFRGYHFELLPFGSGRRICPGMMLGLTNVKLILAQLVHCFDWDLPNGMQSQELDMTEKFGLTIPRAEKLLVVPSTRLQVLLE